MSDNHLYRVAGALAVGCGLLIAFDKIVPDSFWVSTLGLMAGLFGLFMLTAIWMRQRETAGWIGDLGYALNSAGLALMVGVSFLFNYAFPYLDGASSQAFYGGPGWQMVQASYGVYAAGVLLFGFSIWRAGVFARPAAVLYVAGFVGAWVGFAWRLAPTVDLWGSLVASGAIVWLGLGLFADRPAAVREVAAT